MARVKWDSEMKLVWAPVFLDDFVQSRTSPKDLPPILEKIRDNYSIGKNFLLLYNETADKVAAIFKSTAAEKNQKVLNLFGGETVNDNVLIHIDETNLEHAEEKILKKLKELKLE
jgi:hypothetical protein